MISIATPVGCFLVFFAIHDSGTGMCFLSWEESETAPFALRFDEKKFTYLPGMVLVQDAKEGDQLELKYQVGKQSRPESLALERKSRWNGWWNIQKT